MRKYLLILWLAFGLVAFARAETKVTVECIKNDDANGAFALNTVPRPSTNDAASSAKFLLLSGAADRNGGGLEKLHDGRLPEEEDQPAENFFFAAGSQGGLLEIDLGHPINIRQINTYSWHSNTRAPQVYHLYAAEGNETNFNAKPIAGKSPEQCGWKLVASVNTKPASGEVGGQYGVSIADTETTLGKYRYVLFDIAATEEQDGFGNTFYSEIDVVDADSVTAPGVLKSPENFTIKTTDGKCSISIDTSGAPTLKEWAETKLAPVLAEWYPQIVAELPSDGFKAPDRMRIILKPMDGVAFTTGRSVSANSQWLEKELNGEAVGSLIHEAVHVVQQYGGSRHKPGWLVEGIPDYIRWFKYEPQSHGADLVWMRKRGQNFSPHYNDSYRITANFLNWVSGKYDKEIVTQMNAAMRDDSYNESLWKKYTGKTLEELGGEWKREIETQLHASAS